MTEDTSSHYHGVSKYPVPINDPRCPICNADGHLSDKDASCKCWHSKRAHIQGLRCAFCYGKRKCEKFVPTNFVEPL